MNQLNLPVEEFTTPNPVTAKEDAKIDELGRLMRDHGIRHIPIVRGDRVVGIISDRDLRLLSALTFNEQSLIRAKDIMVADPVCVSSESTLDEVAFEMSDKKIGSVIVNDGEDKFLGIFTVTDALNALIEMARSDVNH